MKRLLTTKTMEYLTASAIIVLAGVVLPLYIFLLPDYWTGGKETILMTYTRPGVCGYRDDLAFAPMRYPPFKVLTDQHGILLCIEMTSFFDRVNGR